MNPKSAPETIVQEIVIHAPAERIFGALTNPNERLRWWGIEGRFQATQCESDLRPGGKWMMRGSGVGGRPFEVGGEYREVERPRLLVFTWMPTWQEDATETVVRFDLIESDGATTVRLTHSGLATEKTRQSHQGWPQLLAALRAYAETR
jgi:uncharacterized protein YndB with AHSA1/START domain